MSNGTATPVAQEKINIDIVTLTRFLTEEQRKHKEATGDFTYRSESFHNAIFKLIIEQPPVPRPAILLQVNCVLYPPSHSDQPDRSCGLLKHNRR